MHEHAAQLSEGSKSIGIMTICDLHALFTCCEYPHESYCNMVKIQRNAYKLKHINHKNVRKFVTGKYVNKNIAK